MSETPELLPCPFCGAQMEDYYNHSFVHPLVESREDSCILAGLSFSYLHSKWGTGEIARWNRRSPAARNSVLEEAARELLRRYPSMGMIEDFAAAIRAMKGAQE